jgi:GAF domain-containing protein
VVETKAPVIIADIHNDALKSDRALPSSLGLVSYAGVPLIARDQVIGVLGVYSKEYHAFNVEEVEFLMTLAGQAAIAIHNAQLYEEAERRRHEAEELARIGRSLTETLDLKAIGERVVSSVLNLFSVKGSTLRLRQPDGSMIRCAAAGEVFSQTPGGAVMPASFGLASRAFAVGKPIWCADMLKDPGVPLSADMREHILQTGNGSIIAVPLRAHENLIGMLTLADRTGRSYSDSETALLQTFAVQVALAVQNARHYEETQANLKRIEALREIDQAITSTLDLQSVLDLLLEKIDVFLPFHAATTIRLYNRATGKFANVACRNIEEQGWKSQVGQGTGNLSRQLLTTKRPVIVANIQEDPQRAASQFYKQYGFISYLAVPLIAKDEVVGILGFYTKTPHTFTQQEVDLLLTLAGQAAMAIQNAQLYEEIDRSRKELETTNASLERSLKQLDSLYTALSPIATTASTQELMSGIIDRVMEATGADAALIRFGHSDGDLPIVAQRGFSDEYLTRVEKKAPAAGAVAWVLDNGEPIIAPDIAAETRLKGKVQLKLGLRSCAILPVSVHGEVRGILHIASRNLGCFNEEQRNHLMAIARQMSIAMENRELFDSVRASRDELARANTALFESNRRLTALHVVAAASSQSLNLDHVLRAAIQKISDIFHFDATQIHIYDQQFDELRLRASFENDPARFSPARSFKVGQGIVGQVAQSGEKIVFEDVQTDARYQQLSRTKISGNHGYRFFAIFPIKGKTRNLGTIACIGANRRELVTSETQLIEAISDQLAVAIENNELYEDVRLKVEELQRKTTELEHANRVKDDFLSVVSHELRTPINVIMGYTSLLKDGVFGEIKPAQEDALAKIGRESADLLALINSVLYASTLETGQTAIEIQEFSLESLLAELRDNYAVTVPPHLAVHWNYPTELPPLKTDRRKLRQILDNMIGNAVKFTEHGQVTVTVEACGASTGKTESGVDGPADGASRPRIEFKVVDTGVGMSPDALLHIFDKFYQADSSETRSYGGVGMGLYIAKKFTELLQGTIGAESIAGQGSTFALRIPVSLYCSSDSNDHASMQTAETRRRISD